jgi:potassium-dependent mechanosensitive channel
MNLSWVKAGLFAVLAITAAWIGAGYVLAQETPRQHLDAVRATLVEIDAAFKNPSLADSDLLRLRAENDPLASEILGVISDLSPRLEASSKRLVELTPKSSDVTAANDAAAGELAAEKAKHDALDADLRTVRALALQIDDNNARIGAARRQLFARQTFARSSSLLSPPLWGGVVREAPGDLAIISALVRDWIASVAGRITRSEALGLLALGLGILAAIPPMRWITRRVIARDPDIAAPSRLRRALAAIWTSLVLICLPLFGLGIVTYALDASDVSDPRLQGIEDAFLDGLRLIFVINGLARGLLAPRQRPWRMVDLSDRVAALVFRFWLGVAAIVALERLIEPAADAVASLNITVAARAVGGALVAISMASTLRSIIVARLTSAGGTPALANRGGAARPLVWLLIALITGALLTGYIAFATFIIEQMIWIVSLASVLYLVAVVIQEGAEALLQSDAPLGRSLMIMVGLKREALEQIVVLIQGFSRVALIVTAVLAILAPWGIQSQDMFGSLRAAYFGFKVGDVTVSVSSLLTAVAVFVVGVVITRAVQSWLTSDYLPRTRLDAGISNSIRTIFGYIGFVFALFLGFAQMGLDFQKLTIVAGALGVGIGFGLQSIVNNFVSGLILLWERGIRVGDWILVGTEEGFVRRINARATEIETFDRSTLIVPNATLVSGLVKNRVHADRVGRIIIALNVRFESDPDAVREILIAVARAQDLVLKIPAPLVLFQEFADWALKFELICFVDEVETAGKVKSEMNFDLHRRLKEAGVLVAYPQLETQVRGAWRPEGKA